MAAARSPDGSQILYTSGSRVLVMRADGSRRRLIPKVIGYEPDWR